jgi:hypothetical protein
MLCHGHTRCYVVLAVARSWYLYSIKYQPFHLWVHFGSVFESTEHVSTRSLDVELHIPFRA